MPSLILGSPLRTRASVVRHRRYHRFRTHVCPAAPPYRRFPAASAGEPRPQTQVPKTLRLSAPLPQSRLVVLTFVDYYLPGNKAGGPIRALANLVTALRNEVFFRIVTRDRDLGDTIPYGKTPIGRWHAEGLAEVYYVPPAKLGIRTFYRLLKNERYDAIYLNSFFSRISMRVLVLRRLGLVPPKPVVLAPRGELSPGAMGIRRRSKRFYIAFASRFGLADGVTWQASTNLERDHIVAMWNSRKTAAPLPVVVARELHSGSQCVRGFSRNRKVAGAINIVYVSRISPMKNLLGALRILSSVTAPVTFSIYGPAEDSQYWRACQSAAAALPPNVRVRYCGALAHADVRSVLRDADLFFLPTLGENYGHVIVEALAAGCPVLISTATPWRHLAEAGVGWDIALEDNDGFRHAIEAVAAMDKEEHSAFRARAEEYAAAIADDRVAGEENRALFRGLVGSS